MHKISANGTEFVLGLDWYNLASTKPKSEATSKGVSKQFKGVIVRHNNEDTPSYQAGYHYSTKAKGKLSAAAALAGTVKHLLLVEQIKENEYWIVAIIDGLVVAGTDVVLNKEDAKVTFDKLLATISQVDDDSVIITMNPEAEKAIGVTVEYSQTFASIINQRKDKPGKEFKIQPCRDQKKAVIATVLVASVIGGGYYFMFGKKDPLDDLKRLQAMAEASGPAVKKPKGPTDNEILEKAREEEKEWLTESFNNNDPAALSASFYVFTKEFPEKTMGWEVTEISYDAASPKTIQVFYKNSGYGSPVILRDTLGRNLLAIDYKGEKASASFEFNTSKERNIGDIDEFLKQSEYGRYELIHDLDLAALNWVMGETKTKKRKKEIKGLSPQSASMAKQKQYNPASLTFTISSDSIDHISKAGPIFAESKTVIINTINYMPSKDGAWELNGELYE